MSLLAGKRGSPYVPGFGGYSTNFADGRVRSTITRLGTIVPAIHSGDQQTRGVPADRYYDAVGACLTVSDFPTWFTISTASALGNEDASGQYARSLNTGSVTVKPAAPTGVFGPSSSYAPKNADVSAFLLRVKARFPTNGDYTVYGFGLSNTTGQFSNSAHRFIQVLRNGANWELGSCDGTTISQFASAGGADGNPHEFAVRWTAADIRLYVDGVLSITKTSNLPGRALGAATNWDGVNHIDLYDWMMEWEAA
jgi:hypothetical protein